MSGRALTIGSLFSGIGGLELGLERGIGEGCRTVWQVEMDSYCRAVLAKHWPNAKRYEDVRNVGRETLEGVDIICGGFPCQDISNAGKRVGIGGSRSGLWAEFRRIIGELQPRYALMENVTALLIRGLDIVLGDLAESGYDAEWDCIPASAVGAPHRRDRIWILAYPAGVGNGEGLQLPIRPRRQKLSASDSARRSKEMADSKRSRLEGYTGDGAGWQGRSESHRSIGQAHLRRGAEHRGWWATEPDVGRVANGVPSRVDRLRALGNAVVPQVAEVVGRLIAEREKELRQSA